MSFINHVGDGGCLVDAIERPSPPSRFCNRSRRTIWAKHLFTDTHVLDRSQCPVGHDDLCPKTEALEPIATAVEHLVSVRLKKPLQFVDEFNGMLKRSLSA